MLEHFFLSWFHEDSTGCLGSLHEQPDLIGKNQMADVAGAEAGMEPPGSS